MVELEVLPRGNVPLLQRSIFIGEYAKSVHLVGVQATKRALDAKHLGVHLALSIDALPQSERHEIVLRPFTRTKASHLFFKVRNFFRKYLQDALGTRLPLSLGHSLRSPSAID